MSYSILRIEKVKGSFVTGLQIHNQREKELSNKDIDKEKTSLNYDLHNDNPVNYEEKFKEKIAKAGIEKVRKDAVKAVDILTTSDSSFFEKLSKEEQERYFKANYDYICEKFGKDNVIASVVHLDEKTPHQHTTIVPITDDGRLAAKDFFNPPIKLKTMQTEYNNYMNERGFELKRGITSDRKHIELEKFKQQTKLQELEQELKEKEQSYRDKEKDIKKLYKEKTKDIRQSYIDREEELEQDFISKKENLDNEIKEAVEHEKNKLLDIRAIKETEESYIKRHGMKPSVFSSKIKMSVEQAEGMFKELQEAREIISNSQKQVNYYEKEAIEAKKELQEVTSSTSNSLRQERLELSRTKNELTRYKETVIEFVTENRLYKAFQEFPAKQLAKQLDREFGELGKLSKEYNELRKDSENWSNISDKWDDYRYAEEKRKEKIEEINSKLEKAKELKTFDEIAKNYKNLEQKIQKHAQIQRGQRDRSRGYERDGFE